MKREGHEEADVHRAPCKVGNTPITLSTRPPKVLTSLRTGTGALSANASRNYVDAMLYSAAPSAGHQLTSNASQEHWELITTVRPGPTAKRPRTRARKAQGECELSACCRGAGPCRCVCVHRDNQVLVVLWFPLTVIKQRSSKKFVGVYYRPH